MTVFILSAYGLKGDGTGIPLAGKALGKGLKSKALAWVHIDGNHEDAKAWLTSEISYLDPFIIDALLAEETRPRITQIKDGSIVILRGVNFNEGAAMDDMVSIRLYIDESRIISVARRPVKATQAVEAAIAAGRGPKNSGDFVSQLVAHLTQRFETVLGDLDDAIDSKEELILDSGNSDLRKDIVDIRRQSIVFRRHLAPQRDAISQLRMAELSWLSERDRRHLHESFNHIVRYVEELDAIRERAQIIKDELVNMIADRMNKNTYVLSVIAAIFLPLGFLTGLFGINIGGVPGIDNHKAFLIFCLFLLILVPLQILLFKRLKWF